MNRIAVGLAVVLVSFACPQTNARAQEESTRSKESAAREIIEMTGGGQMGIQVMEQMIPALKQALPDLPDSFWEEFMREVKPSELVDLTAPIYARHFSLEELEGLAAFYRTPLGKTLVSKLPVIVRESMAAGQEWGRQIGERAARKAQEQKPRSKS